MATIASRQMRVRLEPDCVALGMIFDGQIEIPGDLVPFEDVVPTVPTGNPAGISDTQMNRSARSFQIFHNLTARLTASDDENRAISQLLGIAIAGRVQPGDLVWKVPVPTGDNRMLMSTCSDDQIISGEYAFGRVQPITTIGLRGLKVPNIGAVPSGRIEAGCKALNVIHDLVTQHEPVRIVSVIFEAR